MKKTLMTIASVAVATTALAPGAAAQQTAQKGPGPLAYAIAGERVLIKFRVGAPRNFLPVGPISGLARGESIVGIDFRPLTGELIALGKSANLYSISLRNARATRKSSLAAPGGPVGLNGTSFGVDFNPTVDRLRVVSNRGQNLRINVDTGATTIDKDLSYAATDPNTGKAPSVVAAAYTNNDNDEIVVAPNTPSPAATPTQLLGIDSKLNALALQAPPNDGLLNTVGKLGVNPSNLTGFDIFSKLTAGKATDNTGYAVLRAKRRSRLYRIDLETGKASGGRAVGPRDLLSVGDIAVRPQR